MQHSFDFAEQWSIENASSYKEFQSEFTNSKVFTVSYITKNIIEFSFALAYNALLWVLSSQTIFKCSATQLSCETGGWTFTHWFWPLKPIFLFFDALAPIVLTLQWPSLWPSRP